MANSPYPCALKFEYTSEFAPHTALIPTRLITNPSAAPIDWTMTNWDGDAISVKDMIDDFLTEWVKRFPSSVEFNTVTPFVWATPTSDPIPGQSYAVNEPGTATAGGTNKATQETLSFRDTEGAIVKIVSLDFDAGGGFNRVTNTGSIGIGELVELFTSEEWGWSSRNGQRPATFIARTATLNEKLRRSYRMA